MSTQLDTRPAACQSGQPDYSHLANAIIKRFSVIIGSERATRLAASVAGLTLDTNGGVVGHTTPETLDRLAREYRAVGGTVALLLMKRTVTPLAMDAQLPLPGILQ
jgi:hypothetical protein